MQLRRPDAPRDDGPRRPQGLAARAHDRLPGARPTPSTRNASSSGSRRRERAPAVPGHHGRELAAARRPFSRAQRATAPRRSSPAAFDASPTTPCLEVLAAPGGGRRRPRHRRRAAARQLLLLRRREARRRAAHDAGRDARRRRGQGRLRAAPPDARRARLRDQQSRLRRPARAARAARRRRPAVPAAPHRPAGQGDAARARTSSRAPCSCRGRRGAAYPTKEDLAEDVVRVLRERSRSWPRPAPTSSSSTSRCSPSWSFAQGRTRTFMCAALAARKDPAEELEFAVSLINRVRRRLRAMCARRSTSAAATGAATRRRCCAGSYHPLAPVPRAAARRAAGARVRDRARRRPAAFDGKELGLGVVNPRTDAVESSAEIRRAVERALRLYPASGCSSIRTAASARSRTGR